MTFETSEEFKVVGAQNEEATDLFLFFDLMMIGKQKIEAVPERSCLPTPASRCFVRKSPIRAVTRQKAISNLNKQVAWCVPLGIARIGSIIWQPNTSRTINREERGEIERRSRVRAYGDRLFRWR